MQTFNCQFNSPHSFDSSRKRFSLEQRLIWQDLGSPQENLEPKAEKVAEHSITPAKILKAIVNQLKEILKENIAIASREAAIHPNSSQEVKIGNKVYTLDNEALVKLGANRISSSLNHSILWEDIAKAIPDINNGNRSEIIDLFSLYKVDMASLIPKDNFWLLTLKKGLSEEDKAQLQELEDAWAETGSQERKAFKEEIEKAQKEEAEKFKKQQEKEAAAKAAESGEATPAQMQSWENFTDRFETQRDVVDKWNSYSREAKKITLSGTDYTSLLSIEDIKETRFIREDSEIKKPVRFGATPEEIALLQKTTEFIGRKTGLSETVIQKMKDRVATDLEDPTKTPAHIEQARSMREILVNFRKFAAAAHVFRKILQDTEGGAIKNVKAFYNEFFNSNGTLKNSNNHGVKKYVDILGLTNALTKQELNDLFNICLPALGEKYSTWFDQEKRQGEIAEREKKEEKETSTEEPKKDENKGSTSEKKSDDNAEIEKARAEADRKEREAKAAKEAEEAAKIAEAKNEELKTKKAPVETVKQNITTYIDKVDTDTTVFTNLKKWSELQGTITDELIADIGMENDFIELKNKYAAKAVEILVRDLHGLTLNEFINKMRDDKLYVESQEFTDRTIKIPAKSTYREDIALNNALSQIGLSATYYNRHRDEKEKLITPITKLFEPFRTTDENKDIAPEEITDAMFAEFKYGESTTVAVKEEKTAEVIKELPEDPFEYRSDNLVVRTGADKKHGREEKFDNIGALYSSASIETPLNKIIKLQIVIDKIESAYKDKLKIYNENDKAQNRYRQILTDLNDAYLKLPEAKSVEEFDNMVMAGDKLASHEEIFGEGEKANIRKIQTKYKENATPRTKVTINGVDRSHPFNLTNEMTDNRISIFQSLESGVNSGEKETYIYGDENAEYLFGSHKISFNKEDKTISINNQTFQLIESNADGTKKVVSLEFVLKNKYGAFKVKVTPLVIKGNGVSDNTIAVVDLEITNSESKKTTARLQSNTLYVLGGRKKKVITKEKDKLVINWQKLTNDIGQTTVEMESSQDLNAPAAIAEKEEPKTTEPEVKTDVGKPATTTETVDISSELENIAKKLEEKIKEIDTLPEIGELLYKINPTTKKLTARDKQDLNETNIINVIGKANSTKQTDIDNILMSAFREEGASAQVMQAAKNLMQKISDKLDNPSDALKLSIIKHLANTQDTLPNNWWDFRAYVYKVGESFGKKIKNNDLPFANNDWEELHAWYKSTTGNGAESLAQERPDEVVKTQESLIAKLPRPNAMNAMQLETNPSLIDIVYMYKGKRRLGNNTNSIIEYYNHGAAEYKFEDTPERLENKKKIENILILVAYYGDSLLRDNATFARTQALWGRLKDINDQVKYKDVSAFVDGMSGEDQKLLAQEFERVRGFDEAKFAEEVESWIRSIITEADIDAELKINGESANKKLAILPSSTDEIALKLINEKITDTIQVPEGTLVANVANMKERLTNNTEFRTKIFATATRLTDKYNATKEALQKEEAKFILDETFKLYADSYPITGNLADLGGFKTNAETSLSNKGINFRKLSDQNLWYKAFEKAHSELTDPTMKNLKAKLGTNDKMQGSITKALQGVDTIPDAQTFDQFLATQGNGEASKLQTYYADPEKSSEGIAVKTYTELETIYNGTWGTTRDAIIAEREKPSIAEETKENALNKLSENLPDQAKTQAVRITKASYNISKADLLAQVKDALQKSILSADRFKTDKINLIAKQISQASEIKTAIIESAFETKITYLTDIKNADVNTILAGEPNFNSLITDYKLEEFISRKKSSKESPNTDNLRNKYADLAEKYTEANIDTMLSKIEKVFSINKENNALRKDWVENNEYSTAKVLQKYFAELKVGEFSITLLADKKITESATKQIKENKKVQTTLLFDIAVGDKIAIEVATANPNVIEKWIDLDMAQKLDANQTDNQLKDVISPSKYEAWVRQKTFNDNRELFNKEDKDTAESMVKEFLFDTINRVKFGETIDNVKNFRWANETVPEDRFNEVILQKVSDIVRNEIDDKGGAPDLIGKNGLLQILERKENFPNNHIEVNSEKYFQVVNAALKVITAEAQQDTEISNWNEANQKYKFTEYVPELGKTERIISFAKDWVSPLAGGKENPNLKKTFEDFKNDLFNLPALHNVYVASSAVVEKAITAVILPAIKEAQKNAEDKAGKIPAFTRAKRELNIKNAKVNYHPETFEGLATEDVTAKYAQEIVDNIAPNIEARGAIKAAKEMQKDISNIEEEYESRMAYFDFENQKYDANKFFENYKVNSDTPESIKRHFHLGEKGIQLIQEELDKKQDILYMDTVVRIARKENDVLKKVTDPTTTFKTWLDENNEIAVDKFLDWVKGTESITSQEISEAEKSQLATIVEENWRSELDQEVAQRNKIEREIMMAADSTKIVNEWAKLHKTIEIAEINEFTKTELLPKATGDKLSKKGEELVNAFIEHISKDKNFQKNYSEQQKVDIGTYLRAIDYTEYITSEDPEFKSRLDRVTKGLIERGIDACTNQTLTQDPAFDESKKILDIQLRLVPHDAEHTDKPYLPVLKRIEGRETKNAENVQNSFFEDFVNEVINPQTSLDSQTLTAFYKGNPNNPPIEYFTDSVVTNPKENEIFRDLNKKVIDIFNDIIKNIAEKELNKLNDLLKQSYKSSADIRSMNQIKDNIESLQYLDGSIQRIKDIKSQREFANSIVGTLNDSSTIGLYKSILETGIKIPDFQQFISKLEKTFGYEGKLSASEDVMDLQKSFEQAFREQELNDNMRLSNAETLQSLNEFLRGENSITKKIANGQNIAESIEELIDKFSNSDKESVRTFVEIYILGHTIDELTKDQVTKLRGSGAGSFLDYIKFLESSTGISDEEFKKLITQSISDPKIEELSRKVTHEGYKKLDDIYDTFYNKNGTEVEKTNDANYNEWLDTTPETMEPNEFISALDNFIRNRVALKPELASSKESYLLIQKYEKLMRDNIDFTDIQTDLNSKKDILTFSDQEKTEYDAMNDSDKFAYLIEFYKKNLETNINDIGKKIEAAIEKIRIDREGDTKPNYSTMLEKARLNEEEKYNQNELDEATLKTMTKFQQLKYYLGKYNNYKSNSLPTNDEFIEENLIYEDAQRTYIDMQPFTYEAVIKAITEQGIKANKRWDKIEIKNIPISSSIEDTTYLDDAIELYMAGNNHDKGIEKSNGFMYKYLRGNYSDKTSLLALTPDKLTDELVNASGMLRKYLDDHFNVIDRLQDYQMEMFGEESVSNTIEQGTAEKEQSLDEEEKSRIEMERENLHKRAESITDEQSRNRINKIITDLSPRDAETVLNETLSLQEQNKETPETVQSNENISHTPDEEIISMFNNVKQFIKQNINDTDPNVDALKAAQTVVQDMMINAAHENGIKPPMQEADLTKVFRINNLRIANHLVDAMQNAEAKTSEELDEILYVLLENSSSFRELKARDAQNLETLRENWLKSKNQEPEKITSDLLREMIRKLPSTADEVSLISPQIMRTWYTLNSSDNLEFKEQEDIGIIKLILNSYGFRVNTNEINKIYKEDNSLIDELLDKIILILNTLHPRDPLLGDKNKDGNDDRNYILQAPYKDHLLNMHESGPFPEYKDNDSKAKFEALKNAFFDAVNQIRGRRTDAAISNTYKAVLEYLNGKDASEQNNKEYITLFYETLMTMEAPEKSEPIHHGALSAKEQVVDVERTKLAEENALQLSLLERMYRSDVLTDAKATIEKSGTNKLKDSKVDFSNLRHLSRDVFSSKFKNAIKGGEVLTGTEAEEAYGTALDLLLSSQTADRDIVGFGDFALHKFYKQTPGIDFPIQAKEKFFKDYKDIKDALKIIQDKHSKSGGQGFDDGYENEPWYTAYKPLAKRIAQILYAQLQRDGVLEKKVLKDKKTVKYLEGKLLQGVAPASLMMMETKMENYMVSSSKVLDVLQNINEEIGINNALKGEAKSLDQTELYAITGYDKLKSPYNDQSNKAYVSFDVYIERLHLLETQMSLYNAMNIESKNPNSPYSFWLAKWHEKSFNKITSETLNWFDKDKSDIKFINEVLTKYNDGKEKIREASHKNWSLQEIRQAQRFDAINDNIVSNEEINDPRTYTDHRFGDLLERAKSDESLQFGKLNQASGPFNEHDIAFNYGLTSENSRLKNIDAIYISNRMRKDFVAALGKLDIKPATKKQKMIDTFRTNPDDIAKLFYAVLGKEKVRMQERFFKVHFDTVKVGNDDVDRAWAIMDIPKEEIQNFLKDNVKIIQNLKWQAPTLREIILAKGTPGFAEFFERGAMLEHIVFDQAEAEVEKLQNTDSPIDSIMEYSLRIHEIGKNEKSIDRPNRAELQKRAKEKYTDAYELYVNRDSAWDQYESNTFVMENDPKKKEVEEMKLKSAYADQLLRDGISTISFMQEYPVTWNKKYEKLISPDTLHNLYDAIKILFADNLSSFGIKDDLERENELNLLAAIRDSKINIFDGNNRIRMERMSNLKARHINAIATAIQFGKIYKKAIEKGTARKEMVFNIFRNVRNGAIDISALLKAQDAAFKAKGIDLTADELYKIGDNLRTRLANNTIKPIELSPDMEKAAREYTDFRTLLAFPKEGYANMNDESFMVWKIRVMSKTEKMFSERMQKLIGPFFGYKLDKNKLNKIVAGYVYIQDQRRNQASFEKGSEEYNAIEKNIKNKNEYIETNTGIDDALLKLETLLINDYGELLRKVVNDIPLSESADFFAGFGMNVDVSAQRAQMGWNAGIKLPEGHQIDVMLTVTPGEGAGIQAGGSKTWSDLGAEGRGQVQVFAHGGFNAGLSGTAARFTGGIEYTKLEGESRETRGSIGAFATAEIGPGGVSATVGVMASVGQLTPEEKEAKYKDQLKIAREGTLKKEYSRIDEYVEEKFGQESSDARSDNERNEIKDAIRKAMENVFIEAIGNAEASNAAMPKNIEFTKFEVGVSVGIDTKVPTAGLPVHLHMAAVFSVDGKVFVTRFATPEHIMDESSDNEIMYILEKEGITAGEMTLTSPQTVDNSNMLSSENARNMLDDIDEARGRLIKSGEGGDKIYTSKGEEGIALKHSYELSVSMGSFDEAKLAFETEFNEYMDTYRDKIKAAQLTLSDTADLHKKTINLLNTPGLTEIHIDPSAEHLVDIDSDGNMIFDFASGFPIITKEVFEFEANNYGANTVNIITIKSNRHLSRKQIEASEQNYYVMLRNDSEVSSKALKMKPRRAIDLDLSMVEKAKAKTKEEFFAKLKALYDRSKHIDDMHHKFIDKFGKTEAVDPKYEYISDDSVKDIKEAVKAFIPRKGTNRHLRELIEKYNTLSIKVKESELRNVNMLEGKEQLDLTPTQVQETELLIKEIQKWCKDNKSKFKLNINVPLNNYEIQYFLGQMVFATFYNIHRLSYTSESYFIKPSEIFGDPDPAKREKPKVRSLNNPMYKTMSNYLAHLHGHGKNMAESIAENYIRNHYPKLEGEARENKLKTLTESLIGDSEGAVHKLISDKLNVDLPTAKRYCDFLAYTLVKGTANEEFLTKEGLVFTSEELNEKNPNSLPNIMKRPETIKAFYGAYEDIFEGEGKSAHDEDSMLLTSLNASFASARYFEDFGWYSAGGRAVEALSANFGGLRKSFKYDLGEADTQENLEKARAVFEYMRPLPKVGKEGGVEYNPLSSDNGFNFFITGKKDIKDTAEKDPKRSEAVQKSNELYNKIEISMQDVKEYLSTPMGMKVLEWAGVFLKENQAEMLFKLFEHIRATDYDALTSEDALKGDTKKAFVEFMNINRVLREIEYFNTNPDNKDNAFYTVGLGGSEYETQIRYIPVDKIENGTKALTGAFEAIEDNRDFDDNAREFLEKFAGIGTEEVNKILDNTNYRQNCIDYLKANEKTIGFAPKEVDGLFQGLNNRLDVVRQFSRIIALSKFTPLSKQEKLRIFNGSEKTKNIITQIKAQNEKEYLNQKNSRKMPDGSIQDVVPVAYIFKSSDPENVMIVNVGGISATGTFLKCGNWSTLGQEELSLFVQEQRGTALEGGGSAMTRTVDIVDPKTEGEYTRISTGISGSGRVKVTGPQPPNSAKIDNNSLGKDNGPIPDGGTGHVDGLEPVTDGTTTSPTTTDDHTVSFTPESIGGTTGTHGGTEAPEGISHHKGPGNSEDFKDKSSTKEKKKKNTGESSEPDL